MLEEYLKENNIDIAILCIPKEGAQSLVERLVGLGITGIWNFAPLDLEVPSNVIVENVNLTESLFTLSYLMKDNN
jgi:redox-sensing transcriptional repressor